MYIVCVSCCEMKKLHAWIVEKYRKRCEHVTRYEMVNKYIMSWLAKRDYYLRTRTFYDELWIYNDNSYRKKIGHMGWYRIFGHILIVINTNFLINIKETCKFSMMLKFKLLFLPI